MEEMCDMAFCTGQMFRPPEHAPSSRFLLSLSVLRFDFADLVAEGSGLFVFEAVGAVVVTYTAQLVR